MLQLINSAQIIALLVGVCVFFAVIFVAVIKDEISSKNSRNPREDKNEWLFSNWEEKVYDTFTRNDPEIILRKLGVEVDEYKRNCQVAKIKQPKLKKLAADKIVGIFILLLALVLIIASNGSGFVAPVALVLVAMLIYQGDVDKVKKQAKANRNKIEKDLPRFLDLLQTALYIDIPVSDAILITAKHLKNTLISKELIASIAETQMGSVSWQSALQELALVYDVDILSDFVQYLINGYEKGLNIYDVVSRQAVETRKISLISAEENASKLNTSILIPIGIFKVFPLIAIIGYPIVYQMLGNGTLF